MTHQAGAEFFRSKRPWSKRKDTILGYYLAPYLPKIATQKRPLLIVDAFAGPGEFEDGEPGSPLIICSAIEKARSRGLAVPVRALFIEADEQMYPRLQTRIAGFKFAEPKAGRFVEHLSQIASLASQSSTFLYLDPYTVEGLKWAGMDEVFSLLNRGLSIEVLLNLNVASFVRRGLAALKLAVPEISATIEDADDPEPAATASPAVGSLDEIAGGDWWQAAMRNKSLDFQSMVRSFTQGYCDRLRQRFREVCVHEVLAKHFHKVPKYVLVFGSRHTDALELMNDAMAKSRNMLAEEAKPAEPMLFETRPQSLVPSSSDLERIVLGELTARMVRGALVLQVIRRAFCLYSSSEIRKSIGDLIRNGMIESKTGKARINDDVTIWKKARTNS